MNQYIYVLINPSLRGLLKIGRTTRNPEDRALELSTATGVPQAFIVAYECIVGDGVAAEKLIHEQLASEGHRINDSREFFQVPLKVAIRVIDRVCQIFPESDKSLNSPQDEEATNAISFLELGLAHLSGTESVLQSFDKARTCFEKAVLLREAMAYQYLADIHLWGMGVKLDTSEAIRLLQEGGEKGDAHCFYKLWQIFSGQAHPPLDIEMERNPSELHLTNAEVAFGWYLSALDEGNDLDEKSMFVETYCWDYLGWAGATGRFAQRLLQPKIEAYRDSALKIKSARANGIPINELRESTAGANISFGPMMKLHEFMGPGSKQALSQILQGLDIHDLKYGFSRLPARSMLEQTRTFLQYLT